jgi:hypothetical protein
LNWNFARSSCSIICCTGFSPKQFINWCFHVSNDGRTATNLFVVMATNLFQCLCYYCFPTQVLKHGSTGWPPLSGGRCDGSYSWLVLSMRQFLRHWQLSMVELKDPENHEKISKFQTSHLKRKIIKL